VRTLGVDFGGKWFGIALSDAGGTMAYPLEVVRGEEETLRRLPEIIQEKDVGRVVLGLPRNMDGSLGPKAREVLRFADVLRRRLGLPVETWDERLTTLQAERSLREAGVPPRRWGERVNQMAAQILLQSYLDARRTQAAGEAGEEEAGERSEAEDEVEEDPGGRGGPGEA
jgi:putative Holliday junction resolvase